MEVGEEFGLHQRPFKPEGLEVWQGDQREEFPGLAKAREGQMLEGFEPAYRRDGSMVDFRPIKMEFPNCSLVGQGGECRGGDVGAGKIQHLGIAEFQDSPYKVVVYTGVLRIDLAEVGEWREVAGGLRREEGPGEAKRPETGERSEGGEVLVEEEAQAGLDDLVRHRREGLKEGAWLARQRRIDDEGDSPRHVQHALHLRGSPCSSGCLPRESSGCAAGKPEADHVG